MPLIIFTSPDLEARIWRHRHSHNTRVCRMTLASLELDFPHFETVQRIRKKPAWLAQATWLAGSPQAKLAHYNPLVMSKLTMLDTSARSNPFASKNLIWLDAGIARTCGAVLGDAAWLRGLAASISKLLVLSYPYLHGGEIHGFARAEMARFANTDDVAWVVRGGLFGGNTQAIATLKARYDACLQDTLADDCMGTEESLLTILAHQHEEDFQRESIGEDGLILPFLQKMAALGASTGTRESSLPKSGAMPPAAISVPSPPLLAVYILTFNSPSQLQLVLDSWYAQLHEVPALSLHVVDNSSDVKSVAENHALCRHYGAEHLPQDNLGVCGGRQFVAEHFEASPAAHMLFLEDDMLLWPNEGYCRRGYPRKVEDLLEKGLKIVSREKLDFLKLSFSEFFGSNDQQWAWHNVTDAEREAFWPEYPRRSSGLAVDEMPPVRITQLGSVDGLAFARGEVFYSNWPQLVSRAGNRRMFLERKWDQPHEQFWMAHLFARARRGELEGGVLLASPIEHQREHHYRPEERRES